MELGNSGSMQASSGGDDEQDVSRSDQPYAPPFLASKSGTSAAQFSASFAHHLQRRQPLLPPSTFYDCFQSNLIRSSPPAAEISSRHLNLDMSCPTATQSCTDIAGSLTRDAPSQSPNPPFAPSSSGPTTSNPTCKRIGATNPAASPTDQATVPTTTRGSKKRPRASRRAPTTVLTTDTSNFRQMVQEFTGIPTPPFSSLAFPRARFELFKSGSTASSIQSLPGIGGRLRPFAQKMSIPSPTQIPNLSFGPFSTSSFSFCSSSSSSCSSSTATGVVALSATGKPSTCSVNTMIMTTTSTASGSARTVRADPNSAGNHQLPTEHASLTNQSHGLLQSQVLGYQSLFRPTQQPPNPSQQNYSFPTVFGWRPPAPTTTSMPLAADGRDDQLSIATHTLTTLFSSESSSRGGGGSISRCGGDDLPGWPGDESGSGHGGRYPSVNGGETAGSASKLRAENRSEDASNSSMGEGTVDSWICSSPD